MPLLGAESTKAYSLDGVTHCVVDSYTFSSPEPLVPLSQLSLGHKGQLALGTHDSLIFNKKKNENLAIRIDDSRIPYNG